MKFSTKTPATQGMAVKRLNYSHSKITWLGICFSVIMGLNPAIGWPQALDYTITANAGPGGSISPEGTTSVSFNCIRQIDRNYRKIGDGYKAGTYFAEVR